MENNEILDKKITSSSEVDGVHAAIQGRLHFQATPGKAGSWSADSEDLTPWLQVDLNIRNTRVTGVATQGRNGPFAQWVTEYKLQYSNDGISFIYYREPGKTSEKVRERCNKTFIMDACPVQFKIFAVCKILSIDEAGLKRRERRLLILGSVVKWRNMQFICQCVFLGNSSTRSRKIDDVFLHDQALIYTHDFLHHLSSDHNSLIRPFI